MRQRTLVVTGDVASSHTNSAPRRDYEALCERLDADLLHAGMLRRAYPRVLRGLALARAANARAHIYDNVYCDSEHIALPLAAVRRAKTGPRVTMIAHYLTPRRKRIAARAIHAESRIDAVVLHSPTQLGPARAAGFRDDQLHVLPYQVDVEFWRSAASPTAHIMSAGQEFRDYATLLRAVDGLPVPVRVAAGSPWSHRKNNFRDTDVPTNASFQRLEYGALREAYDSARFVVVPLHDVNFQAGIITILEAMAMAKAVIVSRTSGQVGTVTGPLMQDGRMHDVGERAWPEATGIYVTPGDDRGLRDAISYLMDHPEVATRMGAAGRRHAEAEFSLDHFVHRMATVIAPERAGLAQPMAVTT